METCLLIPENLSIAVTRHSDPRNFSEKTASIWSKTFIPTGTIFYPEEGEIFHGKIDIHSCLEKSDMRQSFGVYDLILEIHGHKVRHCNWIRFARSIKDIKRVNVIATIIKGRITYTTVKDIEMGEELVVYFDVRSYGSTIEAVVNDEKKCLDAYSDVDEDEEIDVCGISLTKDPADSDTNQSSASHSTSCEALPPATLCLSPERLRSSQIKESCTPKDEECDSGISDVTITPEVSSGVSTPEPYEVFERMQIDKPHSTPLPPNSNTLKRKRGKTWLSCEFCGKTFDRPSLLKRHERTHTGEKPHVCDVCSKAFSTSSSLNTHRRIHFGEKPHACNICGKRFTASSNLYYHRMTHTKEKPHKCTVCTRSFPTPGDLRSHMHIHSGVYPFKCELCHRGFSKQATLKNHMALHTDSVENSERKSLPRILTETHSDSNATELPVPPFVEIMGNENSATKNNSINSSNLHKEITSNQNQVPWSFHASVLQSENYTHAMPFLRHCFNFQTYQ